MNMAMNNTPTADDLIWDERQQRQELQARVRSLEDRLAVVERTLRAILGVPQPPDFDPVLDTPPI